MTERSTDHVRAEARIEAALRTLGAELQPPRGWQVRVLAEARTPARRRWWHRREAAFTALAAAAAAVAIVVWRPWQRPGAGPELAVLVDSRGEVARGKVVRVGDVVRAAARNGPGHRAIWIYRDRDELIAACPGGAACTEAPDGLAAAVTLELVGTYTIVALWSATPIPPPAGTRDQAIAAAARSGAVQRVESIVVN
jgi:hypothetical protein